MTEPTAYGIPYPPSVGESWLLFGFGLFCALGMGWQLFAALRHGGHFKVRTETRITRAHPIAFWSLAVFHALVVVGGVYTAMMGAAGILVWFAR